MIMKISLLLIKIILLSQFTTAPSHSQNIEVEDVYQSLEWKFVGPHRGGRSTTVSGFVSKPYTFLMGTTGGGVWKTTDAGNTWENVSDGQITVGSICDSCRTIDENVVYVGTGSAEPRGNTSQVKACTSRQIWEKRGNL